MNVPQASGNKRDEAKLHATKGGERRFQQKDPKKNYISATRTWSNSRQGEIWIFNKQNRQPKMVKTKIQNIIIYTRPSSAI